MPLNALPLNALPCSLRLSRLLLSFSCFLALLGPARASTANDVGSANSLLGRAEVNLQLVDGNIGHFTKPPTGSVAKLGRLRLSQALGDLEGADKILAALTGGEGLAEARARYAAADTLYTKLDGILTGPPPAPVPVPKPVPEPEPGPDPEPEPAPGPQPKPDEPAPEEPVVEAPQPARTVRLGYPHADSFKSSLFTLRRVEGDRNGILQLWAELLPVQDQLSINHRKTSGAVASITETMRQAGFVKDGLAKIPSNGEGVAEAYERLAEANRNLSDAQAYFAPLNDRLLALINMANYPEFQNDLKRLRELSTSYRNPDYLFREQRSQAADALGQVEPSKAERLRLAEVYSRLIEQETDQGDQLEATANGFLSGQAAFLAAAEEQRQALPAEIRSDLAKLGETAAEAVKNQQPMWFTGGIPQQLAWIEDKATMLAVLDPSGSQNVIKEVEAMKASLRAQADSLKELIIRQNRLPSDGYTGQDREAVIAVAIDAWKHQEAEFELLAVRIPVEAWARNTNWSSSNGTWYFNDVSTLQVRLIVADKANPDQAIDRPINVRKDHQAGDSMIGVPMRSFDEALQPSEYLLRDKIK